MRLHEPQASRLQGSEITRTILDCRFIIRYYTAQG